MQPESKTGESDPTQTTLTTKEPQAQQPNIYSFPDALEDQIIRHKIDLNLYINFQQMLKKQKYHYGNYSKYLDKQVSKQQIVNEVIKYLEYLKQSINPLPSDYHQGLLFLLDVFKVNKVLITNYFIVHWKYRNSTGPKMFQLVLTSIRQRIDVKQFVTFNWNHLVKLSFHCCGWFDNDDWRNLVENAENFCNVKELAFVYNQITVINQGDLQKFKSLQWISLQKNPLSLQSQQLLKRMKLMNGRMAIFYNNYQQL